MAFRRAESPPPAAPVAAAGAECAPGDVAAAAQAVSDREFAALADKITRDTSFHCASYKNQVLRRRIGVRMRARGVTSYAAYAAALDDDRREYERLLDALTVNVTRFFRDPSTYDALARTVIPALWTSVPDDIAVWSAGSASGEEAYSLAALFHEHARREGALARLGRVQVTGSDIDRQSLLAAARAEYSIAAFTDTPPELLDRLFPAINERRTIVPSLRALVRFERRDLLREPPTQARYDLIACRNVIIYLGREAQEALLASLHRALRPGGFLVLGRAELLFGESRALFRSIEPRERIFQRVEHPRHRGRSHD